MGLEVENEAEDEGSNEERMLARATPWNVSSGAWREGVLQRASDSGRHCRAEWAAARESDKLACQTSPDEHGNAKVNAQGEKSPAADLVEVG